MVCRMRRSRVWSLILCRQANPPSVGTNSLTVGLLVTGAGTGTAELLGLAPPVVGDEECAVVLDESLLELVLGVLVDVLLVVGDDGLGDGLTDGVDLRGVTTTGDADADVDVGWENVSLCDAWVSVCPCALDDCCCSGAKASQSVRTELVKTEDQDGLVDLEAEDLGLDEGKRLSVDLDEALASLCESSVWLSCEYGCVCVRAAERTLQWATAVAVFFLPKH